MNQSGAQQSEWEANVHWAWSHQATVSAGLVLAFRVHWTILAEGAIALSVTLSGGALFAS